MKYRFTYAALIFFCAAFAMLLVSAQGVFAAAKDDKGPIDINTADQKSLESLPGIGPALAQEIIKGRPYKSIDDVKKVKGISEAKFNALKDKITVSGVKATVPAAAAPAPKEKAAPSPATAAPEKQTKPAEKAAKLAPGQKVNINSATKEQLEALPEIGPVKAQAIIDGRPYAKPEDIMKVKGIKQKIFDKIKDMIVVQ